MLERVNQICQRIPCCAQEHRDFTDLLGTGHMSRKEEKSSLILSYLLLYRCWSTIWAKMATDVMRMTTMIKYIWPLHGYGIAENTRNIRCNASDFQNKSSNQSHSRLGDWQNHCQMFCKARRSLATYSSRSTTWAKMATDVMIMSTMIKFIWLLEHSKKGMCISTCAYMCVCLFSRVRAFACVRVYSYCILQLT